ncbi:NAD(P)H-quinone oxidoreductase [Castellaniella sp. MT123]|uniref:NAD(P)H-quinone oxidoreductase n=1 Tax=Castellaniella sp. MT123 TaxID=3140381 RepID=UPI0031F3FA96|nr:NAD(P)H-quinone oxidoreductase [Castellaniella sp.]
MKLIDHGKGGEAACLRLVEAPMPQPGPGQVLIAVQYAGVNRPDVLQRSGSYPPPADASPYLGLEVSGYVSAVGEGVTQWQPGDAVCALTSGGGYAEYCVVDAGHCLPVPKGLTMTQACALPETYFTVWTNVFQRGRLQQGESILIHGGSSGIGLTAIQLAKAHGARVLTTVGNAAKAQACQELGADVAIQYREQDFVDVVAQETGGCGVDMVLDMVGGDYIPRNVRCLALEGRLVQIAFLQGSQVDFDFMPMMLRRLTLTGSTLRARSVAQKSALAADVRKHVWPLLEQGRCLPVIHRVFAMDQVQEAHRLMESSQHIGKLVLEIAGEQHAA